MALLTVDTSWKRMCDRRARSSSRKARSTCRSRSILNRARADPAAVSANEAHPHGTINTREPTRRSFCSCRSERAADDRERTTLSDVLNSLCDTVDAHAPDLMTSVMLTDPDVKRLRLVAGRRIPQG